MARATPLRATAADPDTQPASRPANLNDYILTLSQGMEEGLPAARLEAAQRLVAINTPEARAAIAHALISRDDRTQLAAALAATEAPASGSMDSPTPGASWIPALRTLLTGDRTTADAAARALARFDDSPAAYQALIETARSRRPGQIPAIHAMGRVVQKPVAQALVGLVSDPAQPSSVREAAAGSLGQLSGQAANADDPAAWDAWWSARNSLTDENWRARIIVEQHRLVVSSEQRAAERLAALRIHVNDTLSRQYDDQPAGRKIDFLLGLLNDPDPDFRAAGASIVPEAVNASLILKSDVKERLESLLGDASPEVRLQVAHALEKLSDANALDSIVLQLRIEPDIRVKKALIQTLAHLDIQAVPELEQLLDDSSESVAGAAADAISTVAPTIQNNPQVMQAVYQKVLQTLIQRTGAPGQPKAGAGSADLRAKLILALAATGNRNNPEELVNLFIAFLAPAEPSAVRRAALMSLGSMGELAGRSISERLNPDVEPDPEVRRQAALALALIPTFAWANRLDDSSRAPEPSSIVQEAAWQSFQKVLPYGSAADLLGWAGQFKQRKEYDRELVAEKAACAKLTNDPQSLAAEKQTIGDIYAKNLNMPAEAIQPYLDALRFHQENGKPQPDLVTSVLNAYLTSDQFNEAIEFSKTELLFDHRNREQIGPAIANAAETLKNSNDPAKWAQARHLIELADSLDLDAQDKIRIQSFLKDIPPSPATQPAR